MSLLSYLFPPVCYGCGMRQPPDSKGALCADCLAKWEVEKRATCRRCGRRLSDCACQPHDYVVAHPYPVFSVVPYRADSVGMRLVLAAKRTSNAALFSFLADALAERLAAVAFDRRRAVIAYVPRNPGNRRREGQDQGALLARALGARLGLAVICCFANHGRASQKTLSREERRLHAAKSLRAKERIVAVRGKQVLLVDDVCTGGSSLSVCAALLAQAGAARVLCVTVAKAGV